MWDIILRAKGFFQYLLFIFRFRFYHWLVLVPVMIGLLLIILEPHPYYAYIIASTGVFVELFLFLYHGLKIDKGIHVLDLSPDTLEHLKTSDSYKDFTWIIFDGKIALCNYSLNSNLHNYSFRFEMNSEKFLIPEKAKDFAPYILRNSLRNRTIFNDKKIRLSSDLGLKSFLPNASNLQLHETDYFSSVCTNEITLKEVKRNDTNLHDGFEFMSNNGIICDLSDSLCSNHIGVSSLAITFDGWLLLLAQTSTSAQSPNKLAPSGSGSLDLQDFSRYGNEVVKIGMQRELLEERGLARNLKVGDYSNFIHSTELIGYARLLNRGGKPEFFGLSILKVMKKDIKSFPSSEETPFITHFTDIKMNLSPPTRFRKYVEALMEKEKSRMSFPLYLNCLFLINFVSENNGKFIEMVKPILER